MFLRVKLPIALTIAVISLCLTLAASAPHEHTKTGNYSKRSLSTSLGQQRRTENQLQGTMGVTSPLEMGGGRKRVKFYGMSTPSYEALESQLQSPHFVLFTQGS